MGMQRRWEEVLKNWWSMLFSTSPRLPKSHSTACCLNPLSHGCLPRLPSQSTRAVCSRPSLCLPRLDVQHRDSPPKVHTTDLLKACLNNENLNFHCLRGRVWGSWHPKGNSECISSQRYHFNYRCYSIIAAILGRAQVKKAFVGCSENITIYIILTVEKYLFLFHNLFTIQILEFSKFLS